MRLQDALEAPANLLLGLGQVDPVSQIVDGAECVDEGPVKEE